MSASDEDAEEARARCWPSLWPRLLLLAVVASIVATRYLSLRSRSPYAACDKNTPILVGTHHKTGTVLLKHIFLKEVCPTLGWRCSFDNQPTPCTSPEQAREAGLDLCFLQHGVRFKVVGNHTPYRFIHAIRDPMEVVLSGYQYHLKTTERWANRVERRYNGTTYRKHLNALSLIDGLKAETKHGMRDALKTMPRLLNRTAGSPCTLTVRLEDFEHEWSGTTARMWDLLGVDRATAAKLDLAVAKHNVYGARRHHFNKHVAGNASGRVLMRQLLRDEPRLVESYAKLAKVREKLGYPRVGREGQAAAGAA